MTKEHALEIIKLYEGWNKCQRGWNENEEKILEEQRQTLIKAHQVLRDD